MYVKFSESLIYFPKWSSSDGVYCSSQMHRSVMPRIKQGYSNLVNHRNIVNVTTLGPNGGNLTISGYIFRNILLPKTFFLNRVFFTNNVSILCKFHRN
jgi:hypothetical protein